MVIIEIVAAFIIAFILAGFLGAIFRVQPPGARGYWSSMLFLFIILFLGSWAGGVWISPFGPVAWGIFWLPFLFVGLLIALLLVVLMPYRRPRTAEEAQEQAELAAGAPGVISVAFWILMVALLLAIIAHYLI